MLLGHAMKGPPFPSILQQREPITVPHKPTNIIRRRATAVRGTGGLLRCGNPLFLRACASWHCDENACIRRVSLPQRVSVLGRGICRTGVVLVLELRWHELKYFVGRSNPVTDSRKQ